MATAFIVTPTDQQALTETREQVQENRTVAADMAQLDILNVPPHMRKSGGVSFGETFASALRSLAANKLRTALTMLGIIIGVGAVVGLLAIGNGVSGSITKQLTSNGSNLITLQGASASGANNVRTGDRQQSITLEDAQALAQPGAVPSALAISPEVNRTGQITAGSNTVFASVVGVWATYPTVRNANVAKGDFISDTDVTSNASVIVLGPQLARDLFAEDDPLGKSANVLGKSFRVVGVMESKSGGFNSPDSQAYVPITSALQLVSGAGNATTATTARSGRVIGSIAVAATSDSTVDAAVSEITDVMNARHRAAPGSKADFEISTQAQLLQTVQSTVLLIRIFLVVVAGISLLVGGIGIMNIMLVSVTERTREIGIRKAIGAKEGDILAQFITESVLISLIGALVGVIFGVLVAQLVSIIWQPSPVSVAGIIVSVGVAMATGLFFGVYPARRAASLKPIEALRYE